MIVKSKSSEFSKVGQLEVQHGDEESYLRSGHRLELKSVRHSEDALKSKAMVCCQDKRGKEKVSEPRQLSNSGIATLSKSQELPEILKRELLVCENKHNGVTEWQCNTCRHNRNVKRVFQVLSQAGLIRTEKLKDAK